MGVLDSFRLDGRRALVTGGSKGLGRVIAGALAEAGADVAIVSRSSEACARAANEIADATGKKTYAAAADVSLATEVERLAKEIEGRFGGIDILVNNAGVNIRGSVPDLTEEVWDEVLGINLKAPFLCSRAFGPHMAAKGWGRIINLGSILSVIAIAGRAPYCSAKAGVTSLTRVMALEWATSGVTVNSICPGPFGTDMNKPLLEDPEKYQAFVSKIPMGRWGELDEVAGAAVFLASPASSFVTGSMLFVDGGWTAQ